MISVLLLLLLSVMVLVRFRGQQMQRPDTGATADTAQYPVGIEAQARVAIARLFAIKCACLHACKTLPTDL